MREASLIACLQLEVFRDGVLVVELHFPRPVVHVHGTALIVVLCGLRWSCGVVDSGVLIEVVVVGLPSVEVDDEVQIVAIGEGVAVVEFAVEHVHVATRTRLASHHGVGLQRREVEAVESLGREPLGAVERAVVVGCESVVLVPAFHEHAREREVILLGGVKGYAGTAEEVVAAVGVHASVPLILICLGEQLFALAASLAFAVSKANVGIGIDERRIVVDVETGVRTAARVRAHLHRAIITWLQVFLEHNVDDAGRAFSREFGRRIVDDLYAFDALSGQLLQNLGTVVGSESARLAVDPHLDARVAAQ